MESALNSAQKYGAKFLIFVLLFLWSKIFQQKIIFPKILIFFYFDQQ